MRLRGRAIESLRLCHGGEAAIVCLTRKDFEDCRALPEHAETLVNDALYITGVKMAALLREKEDGSVKGSLRAIEPMRVDRIAVSFGGGGHAQAAGCSMEGPLADACERIAQAILWHFGRGEKPDDFRP